MDISDIKTYVIHNGDTCCRVHDRAGDGVAEFPYWANNSDSLQLARLFVLIPELLEALDVAWHELCELHGIERDMNYGTAIPKIRSALHKARD